MCMPIIYKAVIKILPKSVPLYLNGMYTLRKVINDDLFCLWSIEGL